MSCDLWINKFVKGRTFADVGGLWGTIESFSCSKGRSC